ncbi:MAG TPA: tail fiber domain-containing protein [Pseudolabrys sp.]|nr:tail fiber domain-containing protein [Pseudolabrys sp.]
MASDSRLKRDIVALERLPNGLQLYRYRYVWSPTVYVGVIAQEVKEVAPAAVIRGGDGYLRVDYRQLGLRMQTWDEWIASHPQSVMRRTETSLYMP